MRLFNITVILVAIAVFAAAQACAESARDSVRDGNRLYADGKYLDAVSEYDKALTEEPTILEPRFNKANSYYRLGDFGQALEYYRAVSAESKDMGLVTKAKYNLGNCHFQQGMNQRDADLNKAIEELKTGISYWRSALDIEPENANAARNIEVARLMIKDMLDQLKDQQQDPNQPSDPNGQQQQQQQGDNQDQNQPQQDPNQGQSQQQQDPNEGQQQDQQQQEQQQEQQQQESAGQESQQDKKDKPDATAQAILDKEQKQKQERLQRQRVRYGKVEMDW